jgi:hypothetical protein
MRSKPKFWHWKTPRSKTVGTGTAITLTTVLQDAEQLLIFSPVAASATSGKALVQVLATLTGAGVTPTIAYRADLLGGPTG